MFTVHFQDLKPTGNSWDSNTSCITFPCLSPPPLPRDEAPKTFLNVTMLKGSPATLQREGNASAPTKKSWPKRDVPWEALSLEILGFCSEKKNHGWKWRPGRGGFRNSDFFLNIKSWFRENFWKRAICNQLRMVRMVSDCMVEWSFRKWKWWENHYRRPS